MTIPFSIFAAIHPLWPVTDETSRAPGAPLWVWLALAASLALIIGGTISYLAWRDRRRSAPVERAFRALARRMRVGRRSAELLRTLAEDQDLPPVALLISEHAFERAAAASSRNLDSKAIDQLRNRVFGEH